MLKIFTHFRTTVGLAGLQYYEFVQHEYDIINTRVEGQRSGSFVLLVFVAETWTLNSDLRGKVISLIVCNNAIMGYH